MSNRKIVAQDIVVNIFWMYEGEPFHIQRTRYDDGTTQYKSFVDGEVGTIDSVCIRKLNSEQQSLSEG